jgi:hypothetical protein
MEALYYCKICNDSFSDKHDETECVEQLRDELEEAKDELAKVRKMYDDLVVSKES